MKSLKFFLLSFLVVSQLTAQVDSATDTLGIPVDSIVQPVDTIALARTSAYAKDFAQADQLLTKYTADHTDIHALRLHAQVLYWMKAFDRSISVYETAIQLFPEPSALHLDYARVLYSLNKFTKVRRLLRTYWNYDSTNLEAVIMSAYIQLWNGKIVLAKKNADLLLTKDAGSAEAKDIKNTISNWTVPHIKAGVEYLSDDQPMKGKTYYVEAGVYKSWIFAPTVQAAIYQFEANENDFHSSWLQLGNSVQLGLKSRLKLKAGFFSQNGQQTEFTGSAEISQQLARHFSLQAAMERRPYQYTISSVKNVVMENLTSFALNYNRKDKWFGRAAYEMCQYQDANKINVAYLWILAPVIYGKHFAFSGGYAFRYADALQSTYVSKQSMTEVINNWPPVNGIPGVYDPYFTPENQIAHSILASIRISPSKKLNFNSRLNIAFSAKADNPYLYVDVHEGDLFFNGGFAQVDYTPMSWVNELSIAASKKFYISANYVYDKLLYYKSHKGSIELKYLFSK